MLRLTPPHTLVSCVQSEMRSRHRPSPASAPLDDDDLLAEILLRLPPQPSSLPRASAVCKRWRSLACDPEFSRRFRRHHRRNPPLLGCFIKDGDELRFQYTLDPPNRVPPARFLFSIDGGDGRFMPIGCRHGLLLMLNKSQRTLKLLVWNPVNGHKHHLSIPPRFGERSMINGAVLRSAIGDISHFQVVLVSTDVERVVACVYSSETVGWGNLITTSLSSVVSNFSTAKIDPTIPAVLVGDSLYMLFLGKSSSIIEFDVDRQSLAVIPLPVGFVSKSNLDYSVMRAEGGGLGLLFLSTSDCSLELWKWKPNCDGVTSWVLGRTIELDNLLSLDLHDYRGLQIQGFAEENNMVFLSGLGGMGVFMVQLDSLLFKKLPQINLLQGKPFESVYAAGI